MKKVFVDKYTFLNKSVLEANDKKFYRFFSILTNSLPRDTVNDLPNFNASQ